MILKTQCLIGLIGLTSDVFARTTSVRSHLDYSGSDTRLQRRSGQIPLYHGIPGGGEVQELEVSTNIQGARFTALVSIGNTNESTPTTRTINDPASLPDQPINISAFSSDQKPTLRITSNSGVCETRPEVQTFSGYIPIKQNQSMFFWLFEARTSPDTAPLVLWLNGGPGSSSMIGLFQENGPCRIKLDSSGIEDNPYSWSENANMLYIDQPIGVGFSYGTTVVKTSLEAAIDVYNALQLFYSDPTFSKYVNRPFGLWTESYGGHYGPVMVDYFLQMNRNVGQTGNFIIPVQTLGVGNGLVAPLLQYPSYLTYAKSNPYKQTVPDNVIANATNLYNQEGGCKALITQCEDTFNPVRCSNAQAFCNNNILGVLNGKQDIYDVRVTDPSPYPPPLEPVLTKADFQQSIGAETNWTQSNDDVYNNFLATGDWMLSSAPQLERVINSGVRTLIFDGDADYILNFIGVEAMVDSLNTTFSAQYQQQEFSDWIVDGQKAGIYKTAGTLSYLRVFGAGHEVPAYGFGTLERGKAGLMFFQQTLSALPLSNSPYVSLPKESQQLNARQNSAARRTSPFSIFNL